MPRGRGDEGTRGRRGRRGISGASSRAAPLWGDFSRDSPCWDRYHLYYHWRVMWRRRRGWRLTDECAFHWEENLARSCGIMKRIMGSNNSPVSSIVSHTHTHTHTHTLLASISARGLLITQHAGDSHAFTLKNTQHTSWRCCNFPVQTQSFVPTKHGWRCCNFPDLKTRFGHHKKHYFATQSHSKTPGSITTKHSGFCCRKTQTEILRLTGPKHLGL